MSITQKKIGIVSLWLLFLTGTIWFLMIPLTSTVTGIYDYNDLSQKQIGVQGSILKDRADNISNVIVLEDTEGKEVYLMPNGTYMRSAPEGFEDPTFLTADDKMIIAQEGTIDTPLGNMTVNSWNELLSQLSFVLVIACLVGFIFGMALVGTHPKKALLVTIGFWIIMFIFLTSVLNIYAGIISSLGVVLFPALIQLTSMCWPKNKEIKRVNPLLSSQ